MNQKDQQAWDQPPHRLEESCALLVDMAEPGVGLL
jgi:hypothetical protein